MLVRILRDCSYPDLRRQTPAGDGVWQGVTFTLDPVKECDLLIAVNPPNVDVRVRCPAGNRWLFTQESPIEQYRWHTDSFRHFDRIFTYWDKSHADGIVHAQTSLPWFLDKDYPELAALTLADARKVKRDAVSWVTSNATHKPGHVLRMGFKAHLEREGFLFDLFGRGFTPIESKFDAIFPYKYSIAIENHSCDDYWTEKLADCFLAWTVPIYWGAPNILKYFPARSMIRIDPHDGKTALKAIRQAIDHDHFATHVAAIAEARDLVLNKYQFFPNVLGLMKAYQVRPGAPRVPTFIPANPEHYKHETQAGRFKRLVKRALQR